MQYFVQNITYNINITKQININEIKEGNMKLKQILYNKADYF